jgi:hypothetical protein
MEIQREETRLRSLPCIVHLETSHISTDDHFAELQIDLCDWGWKTIGGFAALKAISSQTIASSNESTSRS